MLPALITTILYSISTICATRSAKMLGGTEANFWRIAVATLSLAIWAYGFGNGLGGIAFPLFFISGMIGVGSDVFLFQGLVRLGSRLTSLLVQCGTAVAGATIEWLWLGTKLTLPQTVACTTILVGVAIALAPGGHLTLTRRQFFWGIGLSVLAAVGNGFGAVISRKGFAMAAAANQPVDVGTAGFQRLAGGLIVCGLALLIVKRRELLAQVVHPEAPRVPSAEKWKKAWFWVVANGLAGQTIGMCFFNWALKTTPTGLVLAIVSTTPLVIIPFAWKFEGDKAHRRSVIGGVIAVVGVIALMLIGRK